MTLTLNSLGFSRASGGSGITLRKNFATNVPSPEWTSAAPAIIPCAFALTTLATTAMTVSVTLSALATTTDVIEIQTIEVGNFLGHIAPTQVDFSANAQQTIVAAIVGQQLTLGGVTMGPAVWNWDYRVNGGAWQNFAQTTQQVYVVMDEPKAPWSTSNLVNDTQLPWTDVLEKACIWAPNTVTPVAVATGVTANVYNNLGLAYETSSGAARYVDYTVDPNEFECTQFLDFLDNGLGNGRYVNCTDCATIVVSFANCLGTDLMASQMKDPTWPRTFLCNQVVAIGSTIWQVPFGNGYSYHEVAWTPPGSWTDPLYDACLMVDTGPTPWAFGAKTSGLPVDICFSTLAHAPVFPIPGPFDAVSYRERLATNAADGVGICYPTGPNPWSNHGRRPVK
jgi:hypothetical protein